MLALLLGCTSAPPPAALPTGTRTATSFVSPDAIGGVSGELLVPIGDLDGDGFADLAVADDDTDGVGLVTILRGGSPTPALEGAWTIPGYGSDFPRALTGGDFDGDGYADVAVLYWHTRGGILVDVYAGSAAGPSATATASLSDGTSHDNGTDFMTAADLDADGFDDLVRVRSDGTAVDIYAGSASGLSATATTSLDGLDDLWTVFVHDLDGDGRLDLVASQPGGQDTVQDEGLVYAWFGTSAGFATAPDWTWASGREDAACGAAFAAGDLDGDGTPELAVGCAGWSTVSVHDGRVAVFDGEALAAGPTFTLDGGARESLGSALAAGDLDGDGQDELVIGGDALLVLCEDATCSSTQRIAAEGYLDGVGATFVVGDHNADGYADLAVAEGDANYDHAFFGEVWWWAGGPAGITLNADPPDHRYAISDSGVSAATFADADGDGVPELYLGASADESVYAVGIGGTLGALAYNATAFGQEVSTADVDGDGFDDVLVASQYGIYVHRGAASGVATAPTDIVTPVMGGWGNDPVLAGIGDVDGDGLDDLAWADPFLDDWAGRVTVVFGDATALGARTQDVMPDLGPGLFGQQVVAAGDVDGDGYDDVLVSANTAAVTYEGAGRVELRRGGPAGLEATAAWAVDGDAVAAALWSPSVGDVNGDGRVDVLVVPLGVRRADLYLGDGVSFATSPAWSTADVWSARILPDLDADGDAEIAVEVLLAPTGTKQLLVYAGTPTGAGGPLYDFLSDDVRSYCFSYPNAGDLDGDGANDLVLPCGDGRLEIWLGGARPDDADGDGYPIETDCDDADPTVADDVCGEPTDTADTADTGPTDTDTGPTDTDTDTGPADTDTGTPDTDSDTADTDTDTPDTGTPTDEPGCACATGAAPPLGALMPLFAWLAMRRRHATRPPAR